MPSCVQTFVPDLEGKVVVDACAAPGGKTTHISWRRSQSEKAVCRLIQDAKRLVRVAENLERLLLTEYANVEIIAARCDHLGPTPESVRLYRAIDAPCFPQLV